MKTIFFDLDGTLMDSGAGIVNCMLHALGVMGIPAPSRAAIERCIGAPWPKELARLVGDDRAGEALRLYRERYERVGILEQEVYSGIPEALSSLTKAGVRVCIVTTKPTVYARRIVAHFGLAAHIAEIYGSPLSGGLEKGRLIEQALASEHVAESDVLMVGDRRDDVAGAHANGVVCLGAAYGLGGREELAEAGADWICEKSVELFDCIVAATAGTTAERIREKSHEWPCN